MGLYIGYILFYYYNTISSCNETSMEKFKIIHLKSAHRCSRARRCITTSPS